MPEIMVSPNLELSISPGVYPPQEDTWFMSDVLEVQLYREVLNHTRPLLVCEVGVGSGFISIGLAKKFPMIHFIGTDISPQSSRLCYKNMSDHLQRNQYDIACMDLLRSFNPLRFQPDVFFFNPPYVRTSFYEAQRGFLEKTWAGGPKGITIIQGFLGELSRFSFGRAFFLSSIFNENKSFERDFNQIFAFQVISQRKIEDEKLFCYEVRLKGK